MLQSALKQQGFALIPDVLTSDECLSLGEILQNNGTPGTRCFLDFDWCSNLAARLKSHPTLSTLIPYSHVAVQCTYFEKSTSTNWLVPTHQDLSIPVAEMISSASLGGWSQKEGTTYVQPPVEILQQLIAIRLHIDSCNPQDGPLQVVPGSHLLGRIDPQNVSAVRRQLGSIQCPASRGSALTMHPLLLHASSKATGSSLRRVLHFLFWPPSLPYGLRWRVRSN